KEVFGRPDLFFAMHASQNFNFFEGRQAGFPPAMHELNLKNTLAVQPRVAVPGAAGFRFCGPVEWCNAFLFPMSRDQFVADVARLDPEIRTVIANPGDVFTVDAGQVKHEPGASPAATMLEDDTALL